MVNALVARVHGVAACCPLSGRIRGVFHRVHVVHEGRLSSYVLAQDGPSLRKGWRSLNHEHGHCVRHAQYESVKGSYSAGRVKHVRQGRQQGCERALLLKHHPYSYYTPRISIKTSHARI